jgi:hypothetical protein
MGTDRQTLLYNCSTPVTLLACEAGVHSNDLMSGAFSLGSNADMRLCRTA